MTLKHLLALFALLALTPAVADVWMWVDAKGVTHFVDSDRTIYTWQDDTGKVHYSDKPDHVDAVAVVLIWHSPGTLEDLKQASESESEDGFAFPGETVEEREERKKAEAYYCKRAQEIYDSYLNAPKLYKTAADGSKVYLTEQEAEQTLAETKARVDELCS